MVEFATINPERYKTLDDFLSRIQWLRRRLDELDAPFGENSSTWIVIIVLKKYPWQLFLKEKIKDGKLSWGDLLKELNRYAVAERSTVQMVATLGIAKPAETLRQESKEEKYKRMAEEMKNQPGYDSNGIHKECGKCHRGGNARCWKCDQSGT